MYYSYVEIEYVATSFSPTRTDLALKLLNMSSIRTVTEWLIRRIMFFAMYHSNQQEEPTYHIYVCDHSNGRGQQKRTWEIEMNEAQETYLKYYSAVD
jgi:hypothetical protein